MHVLLVEDDAAVLRGVVHALSEHAFKVETAICGEDAWFLGSTENFDAIILDLNLPDIDGLTVLKRWREENIDTPVLALTARGGWLDRVKGINLGADDYLSKPFRMEELVARLFALIRRSKGLASSRIEANGVTLDLAIGVVRVSGVAFELSNLELRALSHLMQNKGRAVPSHELMDSIYGVNARQSQNALEALIKRLRQKLGVDLVRTRRGVGYVIDDDH